MKVGAEEHEASLANSRERLPVEINGRELAEILAQHRSWVESQGQSGERADLSCANLEGADLAGVNLQGAFLRRVNLRGADLSLADLRGAYLIQANLREANLFGTKLLGANLQGATLDRVNGLMAGQLAGTNLFGALLSKPISEFDGLKAVARASSNTNWLFTAVLLLSFCTCWIIARTTDLEMLKNSAAIPVFHLGNAIPFVGFYLVAPLLLFGLYIYFHFHLQRLWGAFAELPAVFPDGRTLDQTGPRLLMALVRNHLRWLGENRLAPSLLERAIPVLFCYWVVPATLTLFWGRYLTRQDLRGTMLHVSLIVGTVVLAAFFLDLIKRALRAAQPEPQRSKKWFQDGKLYTRGAIAAAIGIFLSLLSLGTIRGVPHGSGRASELKATDSRRWAPNALWMVGYNPYPEFAELDVSTKPANWTGREEDLPLVRGARLNKLSLRHAEAYRAFLVNAHLWETDLLDANLSEADLRGANLRQANLQWAGLDRASLVRANLQRAVLEGANLARADLRETDLSFATLSAAILVDARLEGANLYATELHGASLIRANLQKADLREANLEGARLDLSDLREAYLWSAKLPGAGLKEAQLQHAFLIEAHLERADLRGADLQGAILRGADLRDANLEGADFRGAEGLSPGQICSAIERRGVQLDESLQRQVDNQCGAIR